MNKLVLTKQSTKLNELVLNLFNKALPTNNTIDFTTLNKESVKLGYLVHPDVANLEVSEWLSDKKINFNATFYKSWNSIISKSRFELYIDQIKHYISTYGTNFTGEVYLPEGEADVPSFTELKVILPITEEEVISRCEKMLYSGIALKEETVNAILTILDELDHVLDLEKVKNKEAKMSLYVKTDTLPKDPIEMVRYLVYLGTGKTMLIKDKETLNLIKLSHRDVRNVVHRFGYDKLSSVFFRFKPIFLAFRSFKKNRSCINKMRKLAEKNHKPMKIGFFENLLNDGTISVDLEKRLGEISNFKKVTLLQAIKVRLKNLNNNVYIVRNQKMYVKDNTKYARKDYLTFLYDVIYNDLVKTLSKKACSIALPEGLNLTLPTSEKSFIGNFPLGSSFDFSNSDNIIGINWRSEEGAHDLDLSLTDINGMKIGWNSHYTNARNSVIYSGDMTSANPEATELIYASKSFNPSIVNVNLFRGENNSKFRFFIAKEKITNMKANYMVNPNNVLFTVDCEMDSRQKCLGIITEDKFVLAHLRTGNARVSRNNVTDKYIQYTLDTLDCYVSYNDLLMEAGFTFDNKNPDIDLRNLSKDTLIDLLS